MDDKRRYDVHITGRRIRRTRTPKVTRQDMRLPLISNIMLLTAVCCCGAGSAVFAHPPAVMASTTLTSDYVLRGTSQSSGEPALQVGLSAIWPAGWTATVWGSTLDTSNLQPDTGDGQGYELDLMVGLERPLGTDWRGSLLLGHYQYVDTGHLLDYDHTEVSGSLKYRQWLALSASWTPEATDHTFEQTALLRGSRWTAEVQVEQGVGDGVWVHAGLGYNAAGNVSEVQHLYGSVGVGLQWQRTVLSAAIIGTDARARERFTDGRADTRLVMSISQAWRLR